MMSGIRESIVLFSPGVYHFSSVKKSSQKNVTLYTEKRPSRLEFASFKKAPDMPVSHGSLLP